jgi:radical SAM protein with 4Fe4S-binding SPASM domain
MTKFRDILLYKISPNCAVWELTLKCNSKCIHCGSNAGTSRSNELSTKEAFILVNELKYCGFKGVALMGGEPLLRNDWFDIASEVKNHGMDLSIITNGLLLEENIKKIKLLNTDCVSLSLDGGKAETHDYLRGSKGSFKKTLNNINLLQKEKLPVSIITTVSKLNFKELDLMKNLLLDRNIAWQIQIALPIGRFPRDLVISREEYYTLTLFLAINHKKYSYKRLPLLGAHCFGYFSRYIQNIGLNPWLGCQAGHSVLGIQSNGDIKGCLTLPDYFVEGNIRNENLESILARIRQKKPSVKGYCNACEVYNECKGGCLGTKIALESDDKPYCLRAIEKEFFNKNRYPFNTSIDKKLAKVYNFLKLFN